MCKQWIREFAADESGHDPFEYALLLAMVVTGSLLYFAAAGGGVASLWNSGHARPTPGDHAAPS